MIYAPLQPPAYETWTISGSAGAHAGAETGTYGPLEDITRNRVNAGRETYVRFRTNLERSYATTRRAEGHAHRIDCTVKTLTRTSFGEIGRQSSHVGPHQVICCVRPAAEDRSVSASSMAGAWSTR